MDRNWLHFGLLVVGLAALLLAIFAGFTAVAHEVTHERSAADLESVSDSVDRYGVVEYDELTADERRMVDDLRGERDRYVISDGDQQATRIGDGYVVSQGDEYHVIERNTTVRWTSTGGLAAIALAVVGVALVVEAIRRHHFPNRGPFG
ncbi:hypothetical protein SAMN05444422_101337 [Halobiforma haloterrestris]|uniref:DUF7979 domain-containing protein n=1 Tax=Natronobacterium haloterrestre TaxID=148448 RepID=A0A1I1DD50_NATHA|nr:hypothetical protein [Halobiforma haloterrestris]SFB70463.1 hypothetical protein SAMN05444422_101337 [Halobiforma haloterrestris]